MRNVNDNPVEEFECSGCGRNIDLEDVTDRSSCCNSPLQTRAYTLTDHRAGRAPKDDRYGEGGGLAPASSKLVQGDDVNPYGRPSK